MSDNKTGLKSFIFPARCTMVVIRQRIQIIFANQTFLGSPIPKFQMGYDAILKFKGFEMNAFLFWNYGNKVYNYT